MSFSRLLAVFLAASWPFTLCAQESPTPTASPSPTVQAPSVQVPVAAVEPNTARLAVPVGPRTIIDAFFEKLKAARVDDAYTELTEGSKIASNAEQSALLRKKTVEAIDAFGQIGGHELVDMEWAGTHLVRLTYLSLGENFPLRWRFYFYQRQMSWRLVDIRVDDRLKDLFQETGEPDEAP